MPMSVQHTSCQHPLVPIAGVFLALAASFVRAGVVVVPVSGVEQYALDRRTTMRPYTGIQVRSVTDSDTDMVAASWTGHLLRGDASAGPDVYQDANLFATARRGRHQLLGVFSGVSDEPVAGGVRTFQAGVAYAYDVRMGSRSRLSLGGGVAGGGLGIELPDGTDVLVAPFPVVRWSYVTESVNIGIDFVASPSLRVAAKDGRLRLAGSAGFTGLRGPRDLEFDVSVGTRLFEPTDRWGDFAGLHAGFRNASWHFRRGDGTRYDANCYAPYARLDLSLVQISVGYGFAGLERYDDVERRLGDGAFGALQLAFPLGG